MRRSRLGLGVAGLVALSACTSLESATVSTTEVAAEGGDAIAVIQATSLGWTLFFHLIDIVHSDFDNTVNRLLVSEAKAMGASRIDIKDAYTTPRGGFWAVFNPLNCGPVLNLTCFPYTEVTAIAVK
ncbi:MAG: hypothetical protein ACKVPX_10215 [Myxococcaceae bacterium]